MFTDAIIDSHEALQWAFHGAKGIDVVNRFNLPKSDLFSLVIDFRLMVVTLSCTRGGLTLTEKYPLDPVFSNPRSLEFEPRVEFKLLPKDQFDKLEEERMNKTFAHWAIRYNYVESAVVSLDKIADINKVDADGLTALHLACKGNHKSIVEKLLSMPSIDANKMDRDGNTALHLCITQSHLDIAVLLLEHKGINIRLENKVSLQFV